MRPNKTTRKQTPCRRARIQCAPHHLIEQKKAHLLVYDMRHVEAVAQQKRVDKNRNFSGDGVFVDASTGMHATPPYKIVEFLVVLLVYSLFGLNERAYEEGGVWTTRHCTKDLAKTGRGGRGLREKWVRWSINGNLRTMRLYCLNQTWPTSSPPSPSAHLSMGKVGKRFIVRKSRTPWKGGRGRGQTPLVLEATTPHNVFTLSQPNSTYV